MSLLEITIFQVHLTHTDLMPTTSTSDNNRIDNNTSTLDDLSVQTLLNDLDTVRSILTQKKNTQ